MELLAAVYVLAMLHLCVHELGHATCAHFMGIRVVRVKAGGGETVLKAGIFELGLLMTGGYTEVCAEDLLEKGIFGKLLFFEAGSVSDAVLWAVLSVFLSGTGARLSTAVFLLLLVSNHFPLIPGSDIRACIRALRQTEENSRHD